MLRRTAFALLVARPRRRRAPACAGRPRHHGGGHGAGTHHRLAVQQRPGGRLGREDGRRLEQGAPRPADHGPADTRGQDLRGGAERVDHRGHQRLPGLQHLARLGAAVPEAGRPRPAGRLPRRRARTSSSRTRRARRPVPLGGRQVLPAAVEEQPGDDPLQQEASSGRPDSTPSTRGWPRTGSSWTASRKIVHSGAAKAAIWPAPSSEFFQSWFDFYPAFIARERRQAARRGRQAAVRHPRRPPRRARSGGRCTGRSSRRRRPSRATRSATGKAAMATVGPWAVAAYKDSVDWGVVPVPTSDGPARRGDHAPSATRSPPRCSAPARTAPPPGTC